MAALTREAILSALDVDSELVPVEKWGGDVRIGVMSGLAREQFYTWIREVKDRTPTQFAARMVSATAIDDNGVLLFSADDLEAVGRKNPEILAQLVVVAMRLNGLGNNAVDEAAKNSEAVTTA